MSQTPFPLLKVRMIGTLLLSWCHLWLSVIIAPLTVGDQMIRTEINILVATQGQGKREKNQKGKHKKFPQS